MTIAAVGLGLLLALAPKMPSGIDCHPERVVIYPGAVEVGLNELQQPGSAVEQLLDKLEANTTREYLMVLVRPGSVRAYRQVRKLVGQRRIDVGYDVANADLVLNWEEAAKSLHRDPRPAAPKFKRLETEPATAVFPEDSELPGAEVVADAGNLLRELNNKRSRIRDFVANVVALDKWGTKSTVSYLADGHLIRDEPTEDTLRHATFFDGETLWMIRDTVATKLAIPAGPHGRWVPDLKRFSGTNENLTVKATERWVIIEERRKTDPASMKKVLQNPEYQKRAAEIEAAAAEFRKQRGLPPMESLDTKAQIERLGDDPPKTRVERYWFRREDGLCYRRETLDEAGQRLSGWRFTAVRTNTGLQPAAFRPSLEGKKVVDPAHDSPAEMFEAMMERGADIQPKAKVVVAAELKTPVFFECRNNQIYFVDKEEMEKQQSGTEHYRVVPMYLTMGILALEPRADVPGEDEDGFRRRLESFDKQTRYLSFLLRDDSFEIFRRARMIADAEGFDTGWELLGADEPLKFGMRRAATP